MGQLYDTSKLSASDQFDYWREELCHAFIELAPERNTSGSFNGAIYQQPLSEVMVSRVVADAHSVNRTSFEISKSSEACYFANLQIKGKGKTYQGDTEVIANPGDLVLVDACKPYTIQHREPFELISVKIPYDLLQNEIRLNHYGSTFYVPAESVYSALLRNYTETLLNDFNQNLANTTSSLADNLVNLVAISLQTANAGPASSQMVRWQFMRLQEMLGTSIAT